MARANISADYATTHLRQDTGMLRAAPAVVASVLLLPLTLPLAARRAEARLAGHEHLSDGRVVVRHRELSKTMEMAERFAAELHLYAD